MEKEVRAKVPEDIYEQIVKEAKAERRTIARQVQVFIERGIKK